MASAGTTIFRTVRSIGPLSPVRMRSTVRSATAGRRSAGSAACWVTRSAMRPTRSTVAGGSACSSMAPSTGSGPTVRSPCNRMPTCYSGRNKETPTVQGRTSQILCFRQLIRRCAKRPAPEMSHVRLGPMSRPIPRRGRSRTAGSRAVFRCSRQTIAAHPGSKWPFNHATCPQCMGLMIGPVRTSRISACRSAIRGCAKGNALKTARARRGPMSCRADRHFNHKLNVG